MKCANVAFSIVPRIGDIEIEFEFDMVFCYGIPDGDAENWSLSLIWSSVLAYMYVWHHMLFFFTRIYLQHIGCHVEIDRPINIMFVVCPSFHSQFMNVGS